MKQILWDWNGTLLDDLWYCIRVRNRAFPPLGIQGVNSLEQYYKEFTFPISKYYENAGVKSEQFEKAAHAWMGEYERCFHEVMLFEDAIPVLRRFQEIGWNQVILSATKLDMLREQVSAFPILPYFSTLLGIGDIYAKSKEKIGLDYLATCGIAPANSIMIGDSLHDAEVAASMKTQCVLVCRGHQSKNILLQAGVPVLDSLTEVADFILGR